MQRMITENIGKMMEGEIKDFPLTTWRHIENTLGRKMDKFSMPISPEHLKSLLPNRSQSNGKQSKRQHR